jgi:hypothetical protein
MLHPYAWANGVWIYWLNPAWPRSFGAARINNPSTTNQLCFNPQSPRVLTIKARYFPLNEDRAYPIPEASVPPERRPFFG